MENEIVSQQESLVYSYMIINQLRRKCTFIDSRAGTKL